MLLQPPFELLTLPAFGQVCTKRGNSGFECGATEKPGIIVSRPVPIRTVYAPAQAVGKVPKGERIARVKLHLKTRLPTVRGERTLGDDKAHNVADIEVAHAAQGSAVFHCGTEPRGTGAMPSPDAASSVIRNEPRGTYDKEERATASSSLQAASLLTEFDHGPGTNAQREVTKTLTVCCPGLIGVCSATAIFPRAATSNIGRGGTVGP